MTALTAPLPPDPIIEIYDDVDALPSALRDDLVAIVAREFPDEAALRGTFFFQSRPSYVVVAIVDDGNGRRAVGLRPVVVRDVDVGVGVGVGRRAERVRVMGGVIPTVDPAHRGQGLGRRLTEAALIEACSRGCDLALAFLFPTAPAPFLDAWGFQDVSDVRFSSTDPDSDVVVVEQMRAFARSLPLDSPARISIAALRQAGAVHLGVGTW